MSQDANFAGDAMITLRRFALSLAVLLLAGTAHAGQILLIGVENQQYQPLYTYEKGIYKGFARELFDAFAQDRGYRVEYRALPVPRLYASFLAGELDFKFPDNASWKQDLRIGKQIHYSAPVLASIDGTSVLPDRMRVPADKIRRLGTLSGFTPWAWMDRLRTGNTTLSENTRLDALVLQALADRVDGVYANVAVINYQLDHVLKQPGALVFNPSLPFSRDYYHLASIKHPQILLEFNAWQKANRDRIALLKRKFGVEKGVPAR